MENKKDIHYEDICFVYFAMPGAQGEEDTGCIITKGENGAVWHHFDTYSESGWAAFAEAFPPLKEYGIDFLYEPSKPWRDLSLSSGHLLIGKGLYGARYERAFKRYQARVRKLRQADPTAKIPRFNWIKLIEMILLPQEMSVTTEKES